MHADIQYQNPFQSLYVECSNHTPIYLLHEGHRYQLSPSLPVNWNGKVMPGSDVFSYTGEVGEIIIQEYQAEEWCMRFVHANFAKKTILRWQEEPMLRIHFALQGDLELNTSKGKVRLLAGTVNAAWSEVQESEATFKKKQKCLLFQALYKPALVQQLNPDFPNDQLTNQKLVTPIAKEWLDAIHQILECPYDAETRQFYYENRVRDILLFVMLRPGSGIRYEGLTDDEVRKTHQVDALILEDLHNWLHIPALAKKVHMSDFKLKLAFKQVIGVNLFERLRDARLDKATKLLTQTNMQIKAIFREVGYKSLSGFEEAFKEKYGMGPSQYRNRFSTQA